MITGNYSQLGLIPVILIDEKIQFMVGEFIEIL